MTPIDTIIKELERRIENFQYWQSLETPATRDNELYQSDRALLVAIKMLQDFDSASDHTGNKAERALQTIRKQWLESN